MIFLWAWVGVTPLGDKLLRSDRSYVLKNGLKLGIDEPLVAESEDEARAMQEAAYWVLRLSIGTPNPISDIKLWQFAPIPLQT